MGIKNRERRRAKQKTRQQQQHGRQEQAGFEFGRGASAGPAFGHPFGLIDGSAPPARIVGLLVSEAMQALHAKDDDAVQRCCDALVDGPGGAGGQHAVDAALTAALDRHRSSFDDDKNAVVAETRRGKVTEKMIFDDKNRFHFCAAQFGHGDFMLAN